MRERGRVREGGRGTGRDMKRRVREGERERGREGGKKRQRESERSQPASERAREGAVRWALIAVVGNKSMLQLPVDNWHRSKPMHTAAHIRMHQL